MDKIQRNIKIHNKTIDKLLYSDETNGRKRNTNNKRALFIYLLILRNSENRKFYKITIAELCEYLRIGATSSNINSIKSALEYLQNNNIIAMYTDFWLEEKIEINEVKGRTDLYIIGVEPDVDKHYTLIGCDYIDAILYSKSIMSIESMICIFAYICCKIERREEIRQVMFCSINKMADDIGLSDSTVLNLVDEMVKLHVIYYEQVEKKLEEYTKKNNIYGLYHHANDVKAACEKAQEIGAIDSRIKIYYMPKFEAVVYDEEINEFIPNNGQVQLIFEKLKFDYNEHTNSVVNKYFDAFGLEKGMAKLKDIEVKSCLYENPAGYVYGFMKKVVDNVTDVK